MKIIAFLNNKGGCGKTASATTVAHMVATKYKKRTLGIDLDPQGNYSSLYNNSDIIEILAALLKGKQPGTVSKSIEDLLIDSRLDIHDTIQHTGYDNLDIIPSYLTLSEVEEQLKADIRTPQQFRLLNHLKQIEDEYDYVFLDCSPSISIININGLVAADEVFIPLKCDAWSAIGMCIARNLIKTVATYNPKLKIGGIFFTQWEGRKNVSKTIYDMLTSCVGDELLPITIGKSKLLEELTLEQKPLMAYDSPSRPSKVTRDYLELTDYILADNSTRKKLRDEKII